MDLGQRSNQLELLDRDDIPELDLHKNLDELHTINSLLGGYKVVLDGLSELLKDDKHVYRILDIGSGGGDTLKEIYKRFGSKYKLELIGVDLKAECIDYARKNVEGLPIKFIRSDYRDIINGGDQFDIIITNLFCHHLKDKDLIFLFSWMKRNATTGCVINDLHRHSLAYYSIKYLTTFFSRSYLVKNDACLSVARGFSLNEIEYYLEAALVRNYSIEWKWAFRWLIILKND
ncbi:methyltransferase domain-containing protein [Flammeovirga kamogawensis]|uniref:Methyltransferase domain-containing protein n=1 Tax=Flammeovirga kamogawensis TaxID=373891 RepID=A0ABX8H4A9_9BACT|nr:methyltransferase domain-containing protein [Flammeovirga kamogawensis]MBB6460183.1 2-polyprenyl-3-methyl-5-hydroxy-6-metoxy-1,4-benzoquinol methylase [Flammeovirga kamogawensis]QWG09995.1 methyltransferase domain-containing protein [Flammeovirga kamogawensis]TRX65503.1 methyltransferase domain-containing protein [Flammeovirga kamogawensis]